MVFLGRKTEGDDLEMVLEEEAMNLKENSTNNNLMKAANDNDKNNVIS